MREFLGGQEFTCECACERASEWTIKKWHPHFHADAPFSLDRPHTKPFGKLSTGEGRLSLRLPLSL